MHAFSGAILGPEHDAGLPTVAQIDGETLILSSSDGSAWEWPLDHVQIVEVSNGYFEVVAADRRLSLVIDQPEAFERALEAERAQRALLAGVKLDVPEVPRDGTPKRARRPELATRRGSGLFLRRPRHSRASVRTLPFTLAVASMVALGSVAGAFAGDLLNGITTEHPVDVVQTPSAEVKVRSSQGSGDVVMAPFVVRPPWEIRWSFEAPDGDLLEVLILTDDGGETVAVHEGPGSGTVSLDEPGTYRLEIRSTTGSEWTISVVQVANPASG